MKQENNVTKYVGEQIKKYRKIAKLTQKALGEKVGVKHNTISSYESGTNEAEQDILFAIAKAIGVTIDDLFPPINSQLDEIHIDKINENNSHFYKIPLERSEIRESIEEIPTYAVKLPIYGSISCGNGVLAYEDVEGYEDTPQSWVKGGTHFYLRANGDSMKGLRIYNGDLLLIRKQSNFENGEVIAVLINGEAYLKKVTISNETLVLESANTDYAPIVVPLNNNDIRIIGKLKKVILNF
ncbi:helix-turn-helix domain-containing protein [Viridibacillus arvi]|uniref:helix-turn-helix domain-containing protein n=1 Tax=Viridibacillus arvi TaxID=263475 RepID=UPI003D04F875